MPLKLSYSSHDRKTTASTVFHATLLIIILALIALIAWLSPIARPQWFYNFSEHHTLHGLPHFFDVSPNLAFHLVVLWGLWQLWWMGEPNCNTTGNTRCANVFWLILLIGETDRQRRPASLSTDAIADTKPATRDYPALPGSRPAPRDIPSPCPYTCWPWPASGWTMRSTP